jgi:hypothetical protein
VKIGPSVIESIGPEVEGWDEEVVEGIVVVRVANQVVFVPAV